MVDLCLSNADERLRSLEEEVRAVRLLTGLNGGRIKVLEETVGTLTGERSDSSCPPRPAEAASWTGRVAASDASPGEALLPPAAATTTDSSVDAAGRRDVSLATLPLPPLIAPETQTSLAKKNDDGKNNKKNRKKNKTKKKKASSKMAHWVVPVAAFCSVALGQELMKRRRPLLTKTIEGSQRGAPTLGKYLGRALGTAENKRVEAEGADPARRTRETCVFCPDGLTAAPDAIVQGTGGFTCRQFEVLALMLAPSNICSQVQSAEGFCCPTSAVCLGGATAPPHTEIPDVGGLTCGDIDKLGPSNSDPRPDWLEPVQRTCCPGDAAVVFDLSATSPTSLAERCPLADNRACGCEINNQADYRGTINAPEIPGARCLPWDSDIITRGSDFDLFELFIDSDLSSNYCRNPTLTFPRAGCWALIPSGDVSFVPCSVPTCDPCLCTPACGAPNFAPCGCPSAFQAEACCAGVADESSCKCAYLKEACRKSQKNNGTEFCAMAEEACCAGMEDPWCGCNMYERICTGDPFEFACVLAAESCCERDFRLDSYVPRLDTTGAVCKCEFFEYVDNELSAKSICDQARVEQTLSDEQYCIWVADKLQIIYTTLQGDQWFRNDGWAEAAALHGAGRWDITGNYCNWYGLLCEEELLTEIDLSGNNLRGRMNWEIVFEFPDLVRLDISRNKLSGE